MTAAPTTASYASDEGVQENLWLRLTEPSPLVKDPEGRRQARLLASLLIIVSLLTLLASVVYPILADATAILQGYRVSQMGIVATVLFEASYFLSRTRAVRMAAFLTVSVSLGMTWGLVLSAPHPITPTFLLFLLVPVILSAAVLPIWYTAGIATLNPVLLYAIPLLGMGTMSSTPTVVDVLPLAVLSVLVITVADLRRLDLEHIEDQRDQLKLTEDRIRALYDATFEGIVVHREGRILDANKAFGPMFGYDYAEVVNGNLHHLIDRRVRERIETDPPWGKSGRQETRGLRKDGTTFPVEFLSKPMLFGGTQVWVTAFRDITEQHRQRRTLVDYASKLERSNAELEQFAYVTAHDLQEPLRDIARYVQLIERRYAGLLDDEGREYVRYTVDGATRMHDLLKDILEFSRVGEEDSVRIPTDTDHIVNEVLRDINSLVQDRGVKFSRNPDPLPRVVANPTELKLVFRNLLTNAVKFNDGDAPTIHVDATRHNGRWQFTVEDDGIGIDAEYHDRIFTLFKRLHNREKYPGTGIGLALCKKVVEGHGGTIRVESTKGHGSRFIFTLPAADQDMVRAAEHVSSRTRA